MKLLIVEDDSGVSELLRRLLKKLPLELDMADSWTSMKWHLNHKRYDVLLLDLGLPDSPPDITLSQIRTLKMDHPEMAICVITGHPSHSKEKSMKAGADDFIHKDDMMRPPGLIQIISALLSKIGSSSSKKMTDQLHLATDATHHVIKEMKE